MKWVVIALLFAAMASAECIEPADGMMVNETVLFCSSTYDVPSGISITANDVVLDCGTAVLRGMVGQSEIGIRAENLDHITIKNCNIITFNQGLYLKNVTNSVVQDNAFLKNRIGIRLLDSYENTIRDNNDKSFQLAVSAVNSKYNVVMLGNKEIERSFCEVNACNEFRDMNVCESGDFYCSKKCSPVTDADCAMPAPKVNETPEPAEKQVEQFIEQAEKEVKENITLLKVEMKSEKQLPLSAKLLIYVALYLLTFVMLRLTKKR